ncbi:MAG: flagellar motor protein MotB [Sphingomonadales bacterium]|nr:MAG: flagellar motor protein MotB [Sphingomonadales bacterium]
MWLTTLADLALLLVGFFVFLQANQMDGRTFAASVRAGFGATEIVDAMPVEMALVAGFAPGSAAPGDSSSAREWARAAARDPRTRLKITGETDGTAQDVDPATGSAAILAADRARAVAAMLVASGAASPDRIQIATATGKRRTLLTLGFEGDRQ